MKIFICCIEPPIRMGPATARWYFVLIRELLSRGYRIKVACSYSSLKLLRQSRNDLTALHKQYGDAFEVEYFTSEVKDSFFSKLRSGIWPNSHHFGSDFERCRQAWAEWADVIHLEHCWSGWHFKDVAQKCLLNLHYINRVDMEGVKFNSPSEWLIHQLIWRAEKKIISHYPYVRVLSERLREGICSIKPDAKVINYSLDISGYRFLEDRERLPQPMVFFVGNLQWYPNQRCATYINNEIAPRVLRLNPQVKIKIIGWDAAFQLKHLQISSNVEILENLPSLEEFFSQASALLSPSVSASGTKTKIIEAMLRGVPVVTTPEGLEGVETDKQVALIETDPEDLAKAVCHVVEDLELQNSLRHAARHHIEDVCDVKGICDQLTEAYRQICQK